MSNQKTNINMMMLSTSFWHILPEWKELFSQGINSGILKEMILILKNIWRSYVFLQIMWIYQIR